VLDGTAVEVQHRDARRIREDPRHLVGRARLEVVIAEHRELRQLGRAQLLGEDPGLLGRAVVREVAAEDEYIRALRDPREEGLERALGRPRAVQVAEGGHPE
jgi:hypothetical protein